MGISERRYVQEAFDSNWVAPLGPNVNAFESSIEEFLGNDANVAVLSSGTAAIHLALIILGVSKGDYVICQSLTFSASANPICYLGATPVFVDSESETWNLSPELLRKAIQDSIKRGRKPKAIIAVHLYGMPYKANEIKEISLEYDIPIIEDSAEALGSSYNSEKCGTLGDLGILSFNGNKIITTSGGGAIVTKDKSIKEKVVFLATQARDDAPHYQHSEIGYNYRMSNVLAGIGRGQMEILDERVAARRMNYEFYQNNLEGRFELEFLDEPEGHFSNRWLSCVLTPSFQLREKLRIGLNKENIESRPLWKPLHLQPVFHKFPQFIDGTSEKLFSKGLCLPSGSNLLREDKERILNTIEQILTHD